MILLSCSLTWVLSLCCVLRTRKVWASVWVHKKTVFPKLGLGPVRLSTSHFWGHINICVEPAFYYFVSSSVSKSFSYCSASCVVWVSLLDLFVMSRNEFHRISFVSLTWAKHSCRKTTGSSGRLWTTAVSKLCRGNSSSNDNFVLIVFYIQLLEHINARDCQPHTINKQKNNTSPSHTKSH